MRLLSLRGEKKCKKSYIRGGSEGVTNGLVRARKKKQSRERMEDVESW